MPDYSCQFVPEYDGRGFVVGYCVVCPEVPFIAAVPDVTLHDRQVGWNSSAVSARSIAGDCYTLFSLPSVVGTVVGFVPERLSNDPRDVPFGFYVYQDAGKHLWSVVENGVQKTTPVPRNVATDTFRIERVNGAVRYYVAGVPVYESALPSFGELAVIALMYAAPDGVN